MNFVAMLPFRCIYLNIQENIENCCVLKLNLILTKNEYMKNFSKYIRFDNRYVQNMVKSALWCTIICPNPFGSKAKKILCKNNLFLCYAQKKEWFVNHIWCIFMRSLIMDFWMCHTHLLFLWMDDKLSFNW